MFVEVMFNVCDVEDVMFVSSLDVRARDVLQLVVKMCSMIQCSCRLSMFYMWRSAVLDVQVAFKLRLSVNIYRVSFEMRSTVNARADAVLKSVSINVSPVLNVMSIGSVTFFSSTSVFLRT